MKQVYSAYIFLLAGMLLVWQPVAGQLVTTVAGQAEVTGDADGQALTDALFNNPHGIAVDKFGRVYIADRWNHKIKQLDLNTGMVTTLAGTGNIGADDGPGSSARFYSPWGLTCDSIGNVYVADTKNYLIRKIDTAGIVTTVAGSGSFGVRDGSAMTARFADPTGITVTPDGTLYVCDHVAHTIRKIAPDGTVSTIAGKAFIEGDVDGPGNVARFYRPYGIEMDWDGSILVADEWNHKIRRVLPNGFSSTVAGSGKLGSDDGAAGDARFNYPWDLVADRDGVIYVMDGYNHVIRRIENDTVSTYVGAAGITGAQDGYGAQASFSGATTICMDHRDNTIYVGDAFNELIRKVEPSTGASLMAKTYYPSGDSLVYNSGDTVCVGETVIFQAGPNIYTTYEFFVNEISAQNSTSPLLTQALQTVGPVAVYVIATNPSGIEFQSNIFEIFVANPPKADFSFQAEPRSNQGFKVNFQSLSVGATRFNWEFGDPASGADNFSQLENPSHTYAQEGLYSVSLSVQGAGGCADSISRPDFVSLMGITAFHPASVLIDTFASGDSLCVGDSLIFQTRSEGFSSYAFYVNEQEVQNSASRELKWAFDASGSFEVYVSGIPSSGNPVNSHSTLVQVADYPITSFTDSLISYSEAGYLVGFEGEIPDARSYSWEFGDPGSGADNFAYIPNPSHVYATDGVYDVSLITVGLAGCSDTLYKAGAVQLINLVSHDVEWEDTICVGTVVNFSASMTQYNTYEFYVNGLLKQRSPAPDFAFGVELEGIFEIQVQAIGEQGEILYSPSYWFYATRQANADFQWNKAGIGVDGLTIDFHANDQQAVWYAWDFGDPASGILNTSTTASPTHTYQAFGTYDVRLIVSTGGTCLDTVVQAGAIEFKDEPSNLFVPSAFTPNGDGMNDVLYVRGQNVARVEFLVYNEWGELMFRSTSMDRGWDGTYKGRNVEPDTYAFVAKVTLVNGQTEILKGKTTLLR